ncbi:MAG TPA: TonB-dependent receptor [Steroidobacteraceae bacterium]|nr:TonB-dependent receptor [Steroidobacteraceae bacterium]
MNPAAQHSAVRTLSPIAAAVCVALAGGPAAAQTTQDKVAPGVEEVVVTATKRGETLLEDTPLSVASLGGASLSEQGALAFNDYMRQVPSLSVGDNGPGDKRIVMRGVSATGDGTVGLYFDEVVITGQSLGDDGGKQPDIKLFDMDRIEVLRGPQGTTFGSSSLSGTIRWLPKAPDYTEFSAGVGARIQTLSESDDTGYQYDAMVNIPLSDQLAVRVSGLRAVVPGFIDSRFGKDIDQEDTTAVRAMLGWKITDSLELSLLAMKQDMHLDGRSSFSTADLDLPNSPTLNGGPLPSRYYTSDHARSTRDDEIEMYSGKLVYNKDWGTITASSSLFERYSGYVRDASAAAEVLSGGTLHADSTGISLIGGRDGWPKNWIRSSELRYSSDWDSPVQILVGAYNQNEERRDGSFWATVDPVTGRPGADRTVFLSRTSFVQLDQVALFGEVTWNINDRLAATAGLRWFDYDTKQDASRLVDFQSRPGPGPGAQFKFGESGTTSRFNVSYDLSDDVLAYVQVAEGFRAGGPNDQTAASIANVVIPAGFGSDSITNYELGLKTQWLDRRLTLNGAIYQIDWSDIQVSQFANSTNGLRFTYRGNGGKAKVQGVELELAARPTQALQFGLGFAYTDSKLEEDLPIPEQGRKGDQLPYVPELTGSVNARYSWPMFQSWEGFVGGDWSYVDDTANRLRPSDRYYRKLEAYDILNLRIGLQGGDGWQTVLSVENALDNDSIISYPFDFQTAAAINGNIPDRLGRVWPRSISLSLRKNF